MARPLSEKHKKFCKEYVRLGNATQAAKNAGYKGKHIGKLAHCLMQHDRIQIEIKALSRKYYEASDITLDRVMNELAKIGFSDMAQIAEWKDGTVKLKDSNELGLAQTGAVQEVSQKSGNTEELKIKLHDKVKALDLIYKHLKASGEGKQDTIKLMYALPEKKQPEAEQEPEATKKAIVPDPEIGF